jgi:peptide methionine sulfoxide reductase msrA/msrB
MKFNPLTPEEQKVIVGKGTEAPGSGEYDHFDGNGLFVCRRCNALLFRSTDKFDAHCGWPSFDDAVLGAVLSTPDADGLRTEITCARCRAHLGHVFLGKKLTPKDTRYCVNSLSMRFRAAADNPTPAETAVLGGGCFWCTEAAFKQVKGVISVLPGYAGGTVPDPSYEQVCGGSTGHAEVIKITYDPQVISYKGILEIFFAVHDPTTLNRQGNDEGTQYRSIILYKDDLQREIADNFITNLQEQNIFDQPIVTEIKPLTEFFEAEAYHHDYYAQNPEAAYCQAVITPKMAKLRKNLQKYLT